MGLDTRRAAIVLHIQDAMRAAGYENLELDLEERPSKYLVLIYTRGKVYPCDGIIKLDHDCQLIDLAFKTLEGVKEIL